MNPERYLNVQYDSLTAEVDISGISRLGGLKSAIKREFGEAIPVAPALIQLYTNSNRDQLITDLDDITPELIPQYYQKLTQGGCCVVIGTLPSPSRQSSKNDISEAGLNTLERKCLEIDNNTTLFWNSLSTVKLEENTLVFHAIPKFFPDNMKSLFVRKSYFDLFNIVIDNLHNEVEYKNFHRMAITGNPGIGKSIFLFYVMWRISTMENVGVVILHRAKDGGNIYVFEDSKCWITQKYAKINKFLDQRTTWYLTDTLSPPPAEVKAVTILVASPSRDHYKEFLKYSSTDSLRYLPVWSLEELQSAAARYTISSEDVTNRYRLIGGIPRFVLEKRNENLKNVIRRAVIRLRIEKFNSIAAGELKKGEEISHLIVHYMVDNDFVECGLQFASSYITERALTVFIQNQHQKLCELLLNFEASPHLSGLRGNLFEAFAHRTISNGGTFDCRNLHNDTEFEIVLTERESKRFSDIRECNDDLYFLPWNPNYPCIDSIIPKKYLFQMTVSTEHPIKLKKMLEITKWTKLSEVYFVVPRQLYKKFKLQSLAGKQKAVKRRRIEILQYVLAIDID